MVSFSAIIVLPYHLFYKPSPFLFKRHFRSHPASTGIPNVSIPQNPFFTMQIGMHGTPLNSKNLLSDGVRCIPVAFLIPPKRIQRLGKVRRRPFIIDTLDKFIKVYNRSRYSIIISIFFILSAFTPSFKLLICHMDDYSLIQGLAGVLICKKYLRKKTFQSGNSCCTFQHNPAIRESRVVFSSRIPARSSARDGGVVASHVLSGNFCGFLFAATMPCSLMRRLPA